MIACHRIGIENVVAASGTALTEQHVKILKRYADKIVLCMDQDQAGREASRRAFCLCAKEGLQVNTISLSQKDPDEASRREPDLLKQLLSEGGIGYFDLVLEELKQLDLSTTEGKREGLQRILPLLDVIATAVEKEHELSRAAAVLGTTDAALTEDLINFQQTDVTVHV